ncbi:BTB And Kelch, partial [Teladorsagia circumcincta]
EIEIKEVNGSVLEALVNFCYSGEIKITYTNVWDVLPTACLIQLDEVKEQCCKFLKGEMNVSNCLKIRAYANTLACEKLLRYASKYTLYYFKDLIGTDEFHHLPGDQLIELIASEELEMPSEEQVFEAVIQWVRFDLLPRQQFLPKLLKHVRLPFCHPEFLVNIFTKELLVKADADCRKIVEEAKWEDMRKLLWSASILDKQDLYAFGVAVIDEFIYAVGGYPKLNCNESNSLVIQSGKLGKFAAKIVKSYLIIWKDIILYKALHHLRNPPKQLLEIANWTFDEFLTIANECETIVNT